MINVDKVLGPISQNLSSVTNDTFRYLAPEIHASDWLSADLSLKKGFVKQVPGCSHGEICLQEASNGQEENPVVSWSKISSNGNLLMTMGTGLLFLRTWTTCS